MIVINFLGYVCILEIIISILLYFVARIVIHNIVHDKWHCTYGLKDQNFESSLHASSLIHNFHVFAVGFYTGLPAGQLSTS